MKIIKVRGIERNQAEKEILNYLRKKGKARTSQIADNLRLDVILVNEILHKLEAKGTIVGK